MCSPPAASARRMTISPASASPQAFGVPWEPHPVAWAMMDAILQAGRVQRRPPAHGDDAAGRQPDRQPDFDRARLHHRQRARHGRRAAHHAGDFESLAPTLQGGRPSCRARFMRWGCRKVASPTGLSAIQARYPDARYRQLPILPARRRRRSGHRGQGNGLAAAEAAIADVTELMAGLGATPVPGEPPPA